MLTEDSTVVAAPEQFACDLQADLLVLNAASGFYYGLSPLGKRIWQLIQEPTQVSAIRDRLLKEYDVDSDRCVNDLKTFLQEMAENGLIEVKGAPAA
jgi:hypothetical protein